MEHIKPPADFSNFTDKKAVFLAGSIEMGIAMDWQTECATRLADKNILLLNPRRDDWDVNWSQSIDNQPFREQVEWELNGLERADLILVYFAPDTKAPITLMELGLHASQKPEKIVVCCPDGYWRKGNVDIVCHRYGVRQVQTLDQLIAAVDVL